MKNKLLALTFCLAPVWSLASAEPSEALFSESYLVQGSQASQTGEQQKDEHSAKMKGPCAKVSLSDSQKSTIKEMVYEAKQKAIQTEADLKRAMLTLGHTFKDANSNREEAAAAQSAVNSALAAHLKIRQDLTLEVNYSVLQPSQREDAFNCMLMIRSMRGKQMKRSGH